MSSIVVDLSLGRARGGGYTADLRATVAGSSAPVTPLAAPVTLDLVAAPADLADYGLALLDATAEEAQLRALLDGCALTVLGAGERASLAALLPHLQNGCDLLLVLAHGRADEEGQTWLYLEDEAGRAAPLSGQELAAPGHPGLL